MILYENTVPLEDTEAIGSPSAQSRLLSIDMNTQVLDACASNQQPVDQMEDYLENDIALDSEDEGENQNDGVDSVSCSGMVGRFSGRHTLGFLRRQQAPAGYLRRPNEVSEHVLRGFDSAISGKSDEESTAGRAGLYDDKFQERVVVNNVVSRPAEHKPFLMNPVNTEEFLDMGRESSMEELLDRKLPSHESKYMTMVNDTNYDYKGAEDSESPQVAESQDRAMQFVDDYLSVCDFGSDKDIPTRTTDVRKSPPSLRSMGTQSLARRLTLGSTASKLTTFDWAENQVEKTECVSLKLHEDSILGFRGDQCGSVSVNQESVYVTLHNEISILQPEEKLLGNTSPNNGDTVWLGSNDTENIGLDSGICIIPDSMECDAQLDAEISSHNADNVEHNRLTPEVSHFGLDTQIAAEAMQELVHADHPRVDACFTHQGSDNTLLESHNAVKNMDKSDLASHEVAFVDWRCKEKRSKSIKIFTVQNKRLSRLAAKRFKNHRETVSEPVVGKNLMTKKLMADEKSCNKRNAEITTNKRFAAPSRSTVQQEEYETTKRYSSKQFRKSDRLRSRLSRNTADGVEYETPPKGIKISSSFHEGAHRKGSKGTYLRSKSGPSFVVNTDSAEGKENCCLDLADLTLSELNPWVYPKGKRTRALTCTVRPSNRCSPFATVDDNPEKYHKVKLNEDAVEGVAKVARLLVYNRRREVRPSNRCSPFAKVDGNPEKYRRVKQNEDAVEGVAKIAKLLVYNRRRKVSLGREHTGSSLQEVVELNSSVNNIETTFDSCANKPLKQCGTPDDASVNMKSQGSGKRKRSFSPLSRSPLIKELIRLGYSDSPPDFLPKYSIRKRATDKVRILFSQNLDTNTLKQQKKIVARLGFAIASCSSDATHFVADRFIRTKNMLEAIGLGKPVVTHLWLESCDQAGYVIDENSYILRDEKKEKEFGFNMHATLTHASQLPLLKGRRVLITPNVKPGVDVINSLVKAVQGQLVQNILNAKKEDELIHTDLLILSSEEDYTICLKFLQEGASIYDSELLLCGILTQKLEYERFRLFKDHKENGDCFMP